MNDVTPALFRLCSVPACAGLICAKGLCRRHYSVSWRTGDPLRRRVAEVKRPCPLCGEPFLVAPGRPDTLTCGSDECHRMKAVLNTRKWRAAHPKPRLPKHPAECACCGRVFGANKRRFTYCSNECRRLHANERGMVRTARMKALPWEKFSRVEIFIRDGWICGLCGEEIDPSIPWPAPGSVSLDHIIPVSKGGPHLRSNVQASHTRCNYSKGNRVQV